MAFTQAPCGGELRHHPGRDPGSERVEYDPSFELLKGPFEAAINDYLRRDLRFESDLPYEILADVGPWKLGSLDRKTGASMWQKA